MAEKLKVLINAYSVCPDRGSEPGLGWNFVSTIARYCDVTVITESEWSDKIEASKALLPWKDNLHFHYLPIGKKVRAICANQGDWRFYYYYRKWQKRAYILAKKLLESEKFDVVHQFNMIGFREPGYLWKLDVPSVWGPIGGMAPFPKEYISGAPGRERFKLHLKNFLNYCQIHFSLRIRKAFRKFTCLAAATSENQQLIEKNFNRSCRLVNETGAQNPVSPEMKKEVSLADFKLLWVGKICYRKQLDLAMRTLSLLKDLPGVTLHIAGSGSEADVAEARSRCRELKIEDRCVWHGEVPHGEVQNLMRESALFFFPSVNEGTPHVVLEALSNRLPVLCFACCGQGDCVTAACGEAIAMRGADVDAATFAEKIRALYGDLPRLKMLSDACAIRAAEMSWESKALFLLELYREAVKNRGDQCV